LLSFGVWPSGPSTRRHKIMNSNYTLGTKPILSKKNSIFSS
jgi:hypothetical protein